MLSLPQAIKNIKAVAAGATRVNDVKPDSSTALVDKPRTSSSLPADFFDNHEFKKPKTGKNTQDLFCFRRSVFSLPKCLTIVV